MKCKCNAIINELLAFVQNKIGVIEDERLVLICNRGFSPTDIYAAKGLLHEVLPTNKRLESRRNGRKLSATLEAMEQIVQFMKAIGPDQMPVFVARDLSKIPPLAFDQTGVTRLLREIVDVKAELQKLRQERATEVPLKIVQNTPQLLFGFPKFATVSRILEDSNSLSLDDSPPIVTTPFPLMLIRRNEVITSASIIETNLSPPLQQVVASTLQVNIPAQNITNRQQSPRRKKRIVPKMKQKELIEFREAFRLFDKDGDGTITKEELGRVMRSLGQFARVEELQDMLQEVDSDGDGNVSFEEFVSILSKSMHGVSGPTSAEQEERELRDAFRVFDKHNRGYICASDLRAVLQCLGEDLSEEEIEDMIKEVDSDGDGRIDFLEFVRALGEPEDACDDDEDEETTGTPEMPMPRAVPAN